MEHQLSLNLSTLGRVTIQCITSQVPHQNMSKTTIRKILLGKKAFSTAKMSCEAASTITFSTRVIISGTNFEMLMKDWST